MAASRTLQDVVFALHFVSGPLTVIDIASWVDAFNEGGLNLQQVPPLGPQQWTPEGAPQTFVVNFGGIMLPRVFLRSDDANEYFIFQSDRVAFGWHRTAPIGAEAAYPGYEELRQRWRSHLERFNAWAAGRFGTPLAPRLVELSYQNAFPIAEEAHTRHVPSYFRMAGLDERKVREFQMVWRETIPESGGGYVDAQASIGTVPPAQPAFLFNFTGLVPHLEVIPSMGQIDGVLIARSENGLDQTLRLADLIHGQITDMYAAAISPEAL